MTALHEYQRLEARGLWRESAEAQRREVVVSLGDATLILTDASDRPLAHWSLAAVERLNPGETPALYSPDGLEDEVLELPEDETEMVSAIERVRRASPPSAGMMKSSLSGISSMKSFALQNTIHLPSGENLAK